MMPLYRSVPNDLAAPFAPVDDRYLAGVTTALCGLVDLALAKAKGVQEHHEVKELAEGLHQWFVLLDGHDDLRDRLTEAIDHVDNTYGSVVGA